MKKLFVLFYILVLSVSAKAQKPIPPFFEVSFMTDEGVITTVGQESNFTTYLEELNEDLKAPVVYVEDIYKMDSSKVRDKIVLTERDGKSPFFEKIRLAAQAGAAGILVVNKDETLFTMGGQGMEEVYSLMIPHAVGIQIRDKLLKGQSVKVRIPFVVEKTM